MGMRALNHVKIAFGSSCNRLILAVSTVADCDNDVTAFHFLQVFGVDICGCNAVHPGKVGVLAVAIRVLALKAEQTDLIPIELGNRVVDRAGFGILPRSKRVGGKVGRIDIFFRILDLIAVGIVLDEYI